MVDGTFVCPACRRPLAEAAGTLSPLTCASCERVYPLVAGIPLLMHNPELVLQRWSERLRSFVQQTEATQRQLVLEQLEAELLPRSRARLAQIADALLVHRDRIVDLFGQAGIQPAATPAAPEEDSLLAYYALVHRDYSWSPEVDELEPALTSLHGVLPPGLELGRTLILGAGTGRLGWEIPHRLPGVREVVALDVNPLPLLVTKRLIDGDVLSLFELPAHARRSTYCSDDRLLRPPELSPEKLQLVFADGLEPPIADAQFDAVLTPWFVDQVPKDLAVLPGELRRVLRTGGSWINYGPFVYSPERTRPAHRYCADEFLQIVERAGFSVTKATYEPQPYMASPLSAQGRTEWVLTMHAYKLQERRVAEPEPRWLSAEGSDVPVPLLDGLEHYAAPHAWVAELSALIDGTRSVEDLARLLITRGTLSDDASARVAVRAALKLIRRALSTNQG